jgi:hypothetical protein
MIFVLFFVFHLSFLVLNRKSRREKREKATPLTTAYAFVRKSADLCATPPSLRNGSAGRSSDFGAEEAFCAPHSDGLARESHPHSPVDRGPISAFADTARIPFRSLAGKSIARRRRENNPGGVRAP